MKRTVQDKITLIWYRTGVEAKFVSHRLLSLAVKEYCTDLGEKEKDVSFEPSGKPYFTDFPGHHLSISHTGDLLLFAFAPFPIGVDVEPRDEIRESVAERYFTPQERKLPFSSVWTGREAVGKLTGVGLSDALQTNVLGDTALLSGESYALFREELEECFVTIAVEKGLI